MLQREPFSPIKRIAIEVAEREGIGLKQLLGNARYPHFVLARWECYVRCYRLGYSSTQIARFFHKDHTSILHGLDRMGVARRRTSIPQLATMPVLTDQQLARASSLWRAGYDTTQIADQIGVSEAAVYNSISNSRSKKNVDAGYGRRAENHAC